MKRMLIVALVLTGVIGCSPLAGDTPPVDEPTCKREHLATPEPGTCMDPMAYRILVKLNEIMEQPEEERPNERLIRLFEPNVRKTIDTTVHKNGLDIPMRIYYPDRKSLREKRPVIVFIHGGGFISGSIDDYDLVVKKMARKTDAIIVSVGYRLAPDYPFPAGFNDAYAAFLWVSEHAREIGGDKHNICIMGDSAGGNLAAAVAIKAEREGGPPLSCQILYYPSVTFVDESFPSREYFARQEMEEGVSFLLTENLLYRIRNAYMGDMEDDTHPYLSPLEAPLDHPLPPALIFTAQCDPLRDEGREYADRLSESGTSTRHVEYDGMIHGFLSFYMILKEGREAMDLTSEFIESYTHFD